jgi:UDP-N-acetylglucosamine--N-acetylmuramyl-(pentapeptide) pyrophosphoryl-undecaprenol N-acetylglucosamine transferase
MNIVFTGGHHNSALQVAKALKNKGYQIYWFGHKHTMAKDKSISAEYLQIKKHKLAFYNIKTGKFYRNFNLLNWFKIGYGFFQSLFLLVKIKPKLIVSFGGYLAVPVVLAGFCLRIPAVTHEQTTKTGLANQFLKLFVKQVYLTHYSSLPFFPKQKSKVVGLPLPKNIRQFKVKKVFNNSLPTLFIIGGKQGSYEINKTMEKILSQLLLSVNVIHQSGRNKRTGDYDRLKRFKAELNNDLKSRYLLKPYFFEKEMINCLLAADLVISRAGAHITYELQALAKPAILIPIPWSYNNEQYENALILKKLGMAKIINQNNLTAKSLDGLIISCLNNLQNLKTKGLKAQKLVEFNAADVMVNDFEKIIQKNQKKTIS